MGMKNKLQEKELRAVSATRAVSTSDRDLANPNRVSNAGFNVPPLHDNMSCGDLPLFPGSLDEQDFASFLERHVKFPTFKGTRQDRNVPVLPLQRNIRRSDV